MERIERPRETRRMGLRLSTSLRAGDKVLTTEGAIIGYPSRPEESPDGTAHTEHRLLQTGPILVERGQRIALLGPNGSGKTTFLRTILGEVQPLAGRLRIGASVRLGYLPQSQDYLDPDKSVLDHILEASRLLIGPARTHLGRFLFSGDDVYKKVGALSGGEVSRLALALLTLHGANVLLLDEPTTHLDLDSQEVLQDVLLGFNGTILMVSHDRYLIDALASHVWMVEDRTIEQYEGNYSDYVALLAERAAESAGTAKAGAGTAKAGAGTAKAGAGAAKAAAGAAADRSAAPEEAAERRDRRGRQGQRSARRREEEATRLEEEISRLEEALDDLSRRIDAAGAAQDLDLVLALGEEYQEAEGRLSARLDEWEQALSDGDQPPSGRADVYVIGLTGNVATGKSTVAAMLARLGAEVIDADLLAHAVMAAGSPAHARIMARFGAGVLAPGGEIDRRALGRSSSAMRRRWRRWSGSSIPASWRRRCGGWPPLRGPSAWWRRSNCSRRICTGTARRSGW